MITIQNVKKSYDGLAALKGVSLEIRAMEFFGLLGPNGAGKSTLMNLLVGYLNPDEGKILIEGQPVTTDSLALRKNIGYVPQSLALYDDLSAHDNLQIFGSLFDIGKKELKERIAHLLNAVQLFDRRKHAVKTFSGGMKRRLNIIASLLHDPAVLLCDEPTVGVDPQSRNAIFEFLLRLNKEGKTIIYTTHYMEEAERLCSRIAVIDAGTIISLGTPDELLHLLPYEEMIHVAKNSSMRRQLELFKQFGTVTEQEQWFELKPHHGVKLSQLFSRLEAAGISYQNLELHKPTLESVFLHLTGRSLRD